LGTFNIPALIISMISALICVLVMMLLFDTLNLEKSGVRKK
jgi:hypothetical protein